MTLRILIAALLVLGFRSAPAQESPYFPPAGKGALHQVLLDLKNPAVVLSVAAEPGQEDLRTLATLRLNAGAKIISAYATNGGSTPSDLQGELPNDVAGRRKEEAHRAMTLIGGEAYFLNLPDVGIVEDPAALEHLWQPDTVMARCVRMIRLLRPDVILLAHDTRIDEGDSVRPSVLRALLLRSIAVAGDSLLLPVHGTGAWRVAQVLTEREHPVSVPRAEREVVHPVWKKNAAQIAEEAGRRYASLRIRYALHNKGGPRSYSQAVTSQRRTGTALLDGAPRYTRLLSAIREGVLKAVNEAQARRVEEALMAIVRTGRTIEEAFAPSRPPVTSPERRVLIQWKSGLEDLRCLLLGIDFPYTASDSILAPVQLVFLRFGEGVKAPSTRGLEIIFPSAMSGTWIVNETDKFRFPVNPPDEFRIVTPDQIETNLPASLDGLESSSMRVKFPVIIIHKDSVSTRDFAFRRELSFRFSASQSVELLTPIVRVTHGERLLVRLQNVSREVYRGTMRLGDSVAREVRTPVNLRKDAVVLDTLALSWADSLPEGDHVVALHIGRGKPVARFLARKFEAAADTSEPVGLISGIASSPVVDALRRLHVPCVILDSSGLAGQALDGLRRVVLDRNALMLLRDAPSVAARLARWVGSGGHLVMLSQDTPGTGELIGEMGFMGGALRDPAATVTADTASAVCSSPNMLRAADWQDWTIARARGTVRQTPGTNLIVHVRDGVSGSPLVASAAHGKGLITRVALDLIPQFQTVQVGAYRLFANLLAY